MAEPEQFDFRVICEPGPLAAEARLMAELRVAAQEAREEPRLLARPLRILVPSDALRRHLSARIVSELGAAAGLVVQTLRSAARECVAGLDAAPRTADLLVPILARRLAREEASLREALEPLDDGYGAVTAAVDDLLDAGLDALSADGVFEALAELAPGPQRERAAAVVRVAIAAKAALAEHQLVHRSALFGAACDALEAGPGVLPSRELWVYGLADATGVLLDFVEALVRERAARVIVDLPGDPADRTAPAPGLGFTERLTDRLSAFGLEPAERLGLPPVESQWCRAAGAHGEVRHAAEQIRSLLDAGTRPERIAIVLRDPTPYRTALASQLRRFAIPFSGIDGFRARPGRRIRALLTLVERGSACPADTWLDACELDGDAGDLRLGLHGIGVGRVGQLAALDLDEWLGERADYPLPIRRMVPSETDGEAPRRRTLSRRALARAIASARRVISHAGGSGSLATGDEHLGRLRELVRRDLGWTSESAGSGLFQRALARLEEEIPGTERLDRAEFVLLLRRALANDGVAPLGGAGAGVQVRSVTDARGCTFEHLFVLGLNRDSFPRVISEDAILPDAIRERIADVLLDLPIKRRGHDEDRYLFAQLLSAAPRVSCSWQAISDDGKERALSPLVERLSLVAGIEIETAISALEEAGLAASRNAIRPPLERAIQVALAGGPAAAEAALAAALPQPDAARVAAHRHATVREIEGVGTRRQRLGPFLGQIGPVQAGDLRLGPMYITRLEGLHYCGWQTFLQRVLRLEPLPDALAALPDLSPLVVGNVMHEALQRIVEESGLREEDPDEPGSSLPRIAPWPKAERVEALVLAAARKIARDEGILLEGYARFLARVVGPHVERVRQLDWAEGPPAVLGVESIGEATIPGVERPMLFRADRVDVHAGRRVFVDYKGGKPLSTAAKPETRRSHLVEGVRSGKRLQAAVYAAAAGAEGRGRYLFSRPGLDDVHANVVVEGSDAELQALLATSVAKGLAAWDEGFFVPRLVDGQGRDGRSCNGCELKEACVQGDSSMRRRLRERMHAVSESEIPEAEAERGLYALWGEA